MKLAFVHQVTIEIYLTKSPFESFYFHSILQRLKFLIVVCLQKERIQWTSSNM